MIFHSYIISTLLTLAQPLSPNTDSLSEKIYRLPISDTTHSGTLEVSVEKKVLFNTGRRIENKKFFLARPDSLSDLLYLYQVDTKEGGFCENPGFYSIVEDGSNHYYFTQRDHTYTKKPIDPNIDQKARGFGLFEGDFFSRALTSRIPKQYFGNGGNLRDTIIDGNSMRYFVHQEIEIPMRFGNSDSVVKFSEGLHLTASKQYLYYLNSEERIVREEEYFYFNKDTQITKSVFRNFAPATPIEVRGMIYDSLLRYSITYTRSPIAESGDSKPIFGIIDSMIGEVFPAFNLNSIKSTTETISALPFDFILLDFSYTSCLPCHESIPTLNRIQRKYGGENFSVIGMNPFDNIKQIQSSITKDSVEYPIYSVNRSAADDLGVNSYPSFFLLDKNKKIRFYFRGAGP
ncbi:MAG: TlpA disulfide reductase family protein, partial [Ignavibacteriota bacterium]